MKKLYDSINTMMAKDDWKSKLYHIALKNKTFYMKRTGSTSHLLWDTILFNETKQIVGGRVKFMSVGAAPISPDIIYAMKC